MMSRTMDRDMIDGKVQGLVEKFRDGLITETVLTVSLIGTLRDADVYEIRQIVARAKEGRK